MHSMSTTTELLKLLRTEFQLTQTEISKRTGIPQPRLSRWEQEAPAVADDALKIEQLVRSMKKPRKTRAAKAPATAQEV